VRARLLLAAAIVAGLAALYLWSIRPRVPAAAEPRLASFDDRRVTGLSLTADGGSCRAVRDGDGWRLVAPIDDVASRAAIEEIVVAARRTPIVREMADADPSSGFGLTPPQVHVAFAGVDAPEVDVGSRVPTGDGVYARVTGRPGVVVLRLPDAAALSTARCALLPETSLLRVQASEISGVDLEPAGPSLRKEGGAWWIEKPRRLPAAPARVDALVAALARASIVARDAAGDAADHRFGFGGERMAVTTAGGATRRVVLGGDAGDGRRYATCDGRRGVLTVTMPALSAASVDALRETKLTNVNRYRVVEIDYQDGARRFSARRNGGSWTATTGPPPSEDAMLALLVGLLEATTSSSEAGTLPAGPRATVAYATDEGARGGLEIVSGLASWSEAPGSIFRLAAPLPPVPGG